MATMKTAAPSGPLPVIVSAIEKSGMTNQQQLAGWLGVSRLLINELVNGRRALTPNTALRLERAFGLDAEELLVMKLKRDLHVAREELAAEMKKIKPVKKRA
jgi:addiction module HigA family antidote